MHNVQSNSLHSNKNLVIGSILVLLALLISACMPATPAASTPPPQEEAVAEATAAPAEEEAAAEATEAPAEEEAAAEATDVPAEEGAALTLEGVTWLLVEYAGEDGSPVASTTGSTMSFQDGQVNGNAGCNNFFASYTVEGNQLTVGQAGSTMMACEESIMAQEQAFLANLALAASFEIVGNQLQILNAEGATILSFEEQVPSPLTGILWLATNYNNGQEAVVTLIEGTEITAIFGEDGTLSGTSGCNTYVASFTVNGEEISIAPGATTMMMCAEPEGVMEQETAFVAALETAATFTIQGDTLEMRTADGAMVALFQNGGPAPEDGASTDDTSTEDLSAEIVDVTWQWVETAYGDDTVLTIEDPSQYTMTLMPDGTVTLQVDCNTGGGTYSLDGSLLSLDVVTLTRVACAEGSHSDVFLRELDAVATFVMDGEDLVLNMFADSGNMRFVRAQ